MLPDVYFGSPEDAPIDWRKKTDGNTELGADDEELMETPEDVIEMLGFDPLDVEIG